MGSETVSRLMKTHHEHGVDIVSITAPGGNHAAFVPGYGGIGSSLVMDGRELLYQHDFFWVPDTPRTRGGWPFLFPNCGRLSRDGETDVWLHDGVRYRLRSHGFAPKMPWTAEPGKDESELRMRFKDNEETWDSYPFAFEVEITYRITDDQFSAEPRFTNTGNEPMPFYAGFHPYIATPPPGAGKASVTVDHQPKRRLVYNDELNDIVGQAEAPVFPQPVTSPDLRELLTEVPSDNEIVMTFPEFRLYCTVSEHYRFVQHYTMEEKGFFCFEPWMGHPNSFNTAGACTWLAPGETLATRLDLWTEPAR